MKHGHLTEQKKQFVEAYCRLGNGTLAAKEAGYKDSPSLVNQASKLKRELSAEISEELTANFLSAAPKALSILMDLAENSASDSVKFQASKDLLDRVGFRPIDRREEIRPQRTPAELHDVVFVIPSLKNYSTSILPLLTPLSRFMSKEA